MPNKNDLRKLTYYNTFKNIILGLPHSKTLGTPLSVVHVTT